MCAATGVWGAATCGGGADARGEIRARPRFADHSAVVAVAPVAYGPRAPAGPASARRGEPQSEARDFGMPSELPVIPDKQLIDRRGSTRSLPKLP